MTTSAAEGMRGTVNIVARHENQATASAKGQILRDMHGVTVYLDEDAFNGWSADRIWVPYTAIDWIDLEHGNAVAWSEGWGR